jgi:hypothetical protein
MQNRKELARISPGLAQSEALPSGQLGKTIDCVLVRIFRVNCLALGEFKGLAIDVDNLGAAAYETNIHAMVRLIVPRSMLEVT